MPTALHPRRKAAFWVSLVLMAVGAAEFIGWGALTLLRHGRPNFFHLHLDDLRQYYTEETYRKKVAEQKTVRGRWSPALGWDYKPHYAYQEENCVGELITYHFGTDGSRMTPHHFPPYVAAYGNSFVESAEVHDDETWAVRLEELTGVGVKNFGVSGYGPYQAYLKFQHKAEAGHVTPYTILGIMNANIQRLPNIFRGFLTGFPATLSVKPFAAFEGGNVVFYPNPVPTLPPTLDDYLALLRQIEARDIWATTKPTIHFPYMVSFGHTVKHLWPRVKRKVGFSSPREDNLLSYDDHKFTRPLETVMAKFFALARAYDSTPIVLFLPMTATYRYEHQAFAGRLRSLYPDEKILDFAEAAIDWDRYTLKKNYCHPSRYGHREIARFLHHQLAIFGRLP